MMNPRIQNILDTLDRVKTGATSAFGEGKEDHRAALKRGLEDQGMETDSTMWSQMTGSNATITRARELMGMAEPAQVEARQSMGLGLSEDKATRIGQVLGTLGSDVVQDRGRSIWWLLNAPQATANVLNDIALKKHAPDLYKSDLQEGVNSFKSAVSAGLVDQSTGLTKKGVSSRKQMTGKTPGGEPIFTTEYSKRRYEPGMVEALAIPAGLAVNSSIGLLNPFGGQEGYKAVFEDEDDASKTSNAIGEVAAKYILGKTGNLLPWDDFKKVRPDVSKGEYMAYKAFKFDNDLDANPMDGDLVAPAGILKYTDEGIHGPEVQFLGRSLPIATGIMPTAAAIAGTAYGARRGGVRGGLTTGLLSTGAAMLTGSIIENERRKRNAAENGIQL
jgi:hypothetical protein